MAHAGAIMAVTAVITTAATLYSTYEQAQAAKKAEELGKQNERAKKAEAAEAARRLENEQKRTENLARARAMGLGVGGDTIEGVLDEMGIEHGKQLAWLKKSGASAASIARRQGELAANQAWAGAISTFGQGVGSAGSQWAQTAEYYGW